MRRNDKLTLLCRKIDYHNSQQLTVATNHYDQQKTLSVYISITKGCILTILSKVFLLFSDLEKLIKSMSMTKGKLTKQGDKTALMLVYLIDWSQLETCHLN